VVGARRQVEPSDRLFEKSDGVVAAEQNFSISRGASCALTLL